MRALFVLIILILLSMALMVTMGKGYAAENPNVTAFSWGWFSNDKPKELPPVVEKVDPKFESFKKELDAKIEVVMNSVAIPFNYDNFLELANKELTPLQETYTFKFQPQYYPTLNMLAWIKVGTIEVHYLDGKQGVSWQYNIVFEENVKPVIIEGKSTKYELENGETK